MSLIRPDSMTYVRKGWGYERWIYNAEYCGKILFFEAGKKCSWHYHDIKDEVLFVHSGKIVMRHGEENLEDAQEEILTPGDAFHVSPGLRHQMEAIEDTLIYEFSTHHEDDDSIRVVKGD